MSAYKDPKTGKWYSKVRYKTWEGKTKETMKRGFKTKKEALEWERKFLEAKNGCTDMSFEDFVKIYKAEMQSRIKVSTFETKTAIIDNRILPFFKDKQLSEIRTKDVMLWQNTMMKYRIPGSGKNFSKAYLKTLHNQLSAIFNHAVKYYELRENPAAKVGNMGHEREIEMKFWTLPEYKKFSDPMMSKPVYYYCFQLLYWCGLRLGEMMALTPADIDFKKKTLKISKTYHRIHGEDIITPPKTPKSNRIIKLPDFLTEELKDYLSMRYEWTANERLFDITKSGIERAIKAGAKAAGVKPIRIHDLRHSHVSLLIEMGYSVVAIAERLGHESIDITYRYAHIFPSVQLDMAKKLELMNTGGYNE